MKQGQNSGQGVFAGVGNQAEDEEAVEDVDVVTVDQQPVQGQSQPSQGQSQPSQGQQSQPSQGQAQTQRTQVVFLVFVNSSTDLSRKG